MSDERDDLDLAEAWVPPGQALRPRSDLPVVRLLQAVEKASQAGDGRVTRLHMGVAKAVLADAAGAVLDQMIAAGDIPRPGTPEWAGLLAQARDGQVEVGFALIVRGQVLSPQLPQAV